MINFWNSLEIVSRISTFLYWTIAIAGVFALIFSTRGLYLQRKLDKEVREKMIQKVDEKIKSSHPIKSKILLSKPQAITPNVETKLKFDRLVYETQDGFWQENRPGFSERAAIYDLTLSVQIKNINENIDISLIIVTSNEKYSVEFKAPIINLPLIVNKSFDIDMGDTVDVFIKHNHNENLIISEENELTFVKIEEIERKEN